MGNVFSGGDTVYLVAGLGCLLLAWWLLKLWNTVHTLFHAPGPVRPPSYEIHKVKQPSSFMLRGPALFALGGLLIFAGFICTICFRNPQFLLMIIIGSLFLTGLFLVIAQDLDQI